MYSRRAKNLVVKKQASSEEAIVAMMSAVRSRDNDD
jgi:hypothetical protein